MKFNHVGIPTNGRFEGEINLPHLKITCNDHQDNPYGVQWMRYWDDAPYPELVAELQSVIGHEAREQFLAAADALPEAVVACVGGGSNAIGLFRGFVDDVGVRLVMQASCP